MAFITVVPLFKDELVGTSGTAVSPAIDMRWISNRGVCSLSISVAATNGVSGTVGSATYEYLSCATKDGTYATSGTFSTRGAAVGAFIAPFTPAVTPFMKIRAMGGTSNPLILTAEMNVQ